MSDRNTKTLSQKTSKFTSLHRDYVASEQKSDIKRFDEILMPDFYCTNPDKSPVNRAVFLKQTAVPVPIGTLAAHDVKIRVPGDFAIVHAATSFTNTDGSARSGRYTGCWKTQVTAG